IVSLLRCLCDDSVWIGGGSAAAQDTPISLACLDGFGLRNIAVDCFLAPAMEDQNKFWRPGLLASRLFHSPRVLWIVLFLPPCVRRGAGRGCCCGSSLVAPLA